MAIKSTNSTNGRHVSLDNLGEIQSALNDITDTSSDLKDKLQKIPSPLSGNKRKYLTIELETYQIYEEIQEDENSISKNIWTIEGRAIGSNFPARELLKLTTSTNVKGEVANINPRGLDKEKESVLIKEIKKGLLEAPERFYRRSNTFITIWACVESITKQKEKNTIKVTLSFTDKQGLPDGQHRLDAIADAQDDIAYTNLDKLRIPVSIQINNTLDNKNSSEDILTTSDTNRHSWCTRSHTLGYFETFKELIPDDWEPIRYYDNQPGTSKNPRCHIAHILKLLAVLDRKKFNWISKDESHPTKFLTNSSSSHKSLIESAKKTEHLLEEAVKIESYFYECAESYLSKGRNKRQVLGFESHYNEDLGDIDEITLKKKRLVKLVSGEVFKISAPESIIFPISSAFRVYLDEDLEWIIPFDNFAFNLVNRLWQDTISYLNKDCSEKSIKPIVMFVHNPEYWRKLCAEAYSFLEEQRSFKLFKR